MRISKKRSISAPASLTTEAILNILKEKMPYLAEKYGVRRLALYGSFAQGKAARKSDVDLLAEFSRPLGLAFVSLIFELEEALGAKVDLGTFETLQRRLANPRYRRIAEDIKRTLTYV